MSPANNSDPYRGPHVDEARQFAGFQRPIPNLHALLIGIDNYASVVNLSGASKDAASVEEFLRSDLSAPASQITNLRNEQATRSGILAALDELSRNPNIVPFDPIVIYYAGHGCEVDSPSPDWGTYDEKTQCLVPWDAGTEDAAGNLIPPIPDYTIAALLYAIATEKGNNITVIFDCCHSASSTRGIRQISYKSMNPGLNSRLSNWTVDHHSGANPKLTTYRARRLDPEDLPSLSRDTDKSLIEAYAHIHSNSKVTQPIFEGNSPEQAQSGFRRFGRSHVLLAACAHAEIAYECTATDSGYFTTALLERLRSSRIHKLTYKVCFEGFPQLPTPSLQSPVCEGDDTGRLFFNAAVPREHDVFVPIQQHPGGYTLKVGIAQGVIPGWVYGLYDDDAFAESGQSNYELSFDRNVALCGTFTAHPCTEQKLYPSYSWCEFHGDTAIPSRPRAKLLKRGISHTFGVFLTNEFKDKLLGEVLKTEQGIIQVDSPDRAKVILDVDKRSGQITVQLTKFGATPLHRCDSDPARVQRILFSMAQWDWHLYRGPTTTAGPKDERIQLHMYRLGESGPALVPLENGAANLTASSRDIYGLKLKSLFRRRLYAYLFYFSTVSQSIKPLFLSVYASGYVDAPLEANGELTIGYGNDDMISGPLSFRAMDDIGYFRIFLTTLPGDFDSMIQPSSFVEPRKEEISSFGTTGEYSDGIEIRKPGSIGHYQPGGAFPTNPPARLGETNHSTATEVTDSSTDNNSAPASDRNPHRNQSHDDSVPSRAAIGLPPRMLTDAEVADHFGMREIWDVVTLKVVLKGDQY